MQLYICMYMTIAIIYMGLLHVATYVQLKVRSKVLQIILVSKVLSKVHRLSSYSRMESLMATQHPSQELTQHPSQELYHRYNVFCGQIGKAHVVPHHTACIIQKAIYMHGWTGQHCYEDQLKWQKAVWPARLPFLLYQDGKLLARVCMAQLADDWHHHWQYNLHNTSCYCSQLLYIELSLVWSDGDYHKHSSFLDTATS